MRFAAIALLVFGLMSSVWADEEISLPSDVSSCSVNDQTVSCSKPTNKAPFVIAGSERFVSKPVPFRTSGAGSNIFTIYSRSNSRKPSSLRFRFFRLRHQSGNTQKLFSLDLL